MTKRTESFAPDRSQSAVEPTEPAGKHDRHDQDARAEDEHVLGLAEIETRDAADEQVADGQVEEPQSTLTVEEDKPSPGGDANGKG